MRTPPPKMSAGKARHWMFWAICALFHSSNEDKYRRVFCTETETELHIWITGKVMVV